LIRHSHIVTKSLTEKIEALPPEKKALVEDLVASLSSPDGEIAATSGVDAYVERARLRRERLLRQHGLYDTSAILRELREEGG